MSIQLDIYISKTVASAEHTQTLGCFTVVVVTCAEKKSLVDNGDGL